MKPTACEALIARLRGVESAVEVGIGQRPDVARGLAEADVAVTATDVEPRSVPAGVSFVRDDVTAPDPAVYADADLVYARRLPPELHAALQLVAREADAAGCFTTLGGDQPAVPARTETLDGVTLFWVSEPAGWKSGSGSPEAESP